MLVGYARILKSDQNVVPHIQALKEAGCERIIQVPTRGGANSRQKMKDLLKYLHEGDILVVWKLACLASSLKDLIEIITALCEKNVGFRSLQEHIDTTEPGGDVAVNIFEALTEFERTMIQDKKKEAIAHGRKRGRRKLLTEEQVKLAQSLMKQPEYTMQDVADQLHISKPTLYRYVKEFDRLDT